MAFLQSLNELFAGLSSQNPVLQAQLAGAFENLDISTALQDALNKGGPEGALEIRRRSNGWGKRWGSMIRPSFREAARSWRAVGA